jgi:hypothetical protein
MTRAYICTCIWCILVPVTDDTCGVHMCTCIYGIGHRWHMWCTCVYVYIWYLSQMTLVQVYVYINSKGNIQQECLPYPITIDNQMFFFINTLAMWARYSKPLKKPSVEPQSYWIMTATRSKPRARFVINGSVKKARTRLQNEQKWREMAREWRQIVSN